MTKLLAFGGNDLNPLIVYYLGHIYSVRRLYALNGGLLVYTSTGLELYVNPDGREVWA